MERSPRQMTFYPTTEGDEKARQQVHTPDPSNNPIPYPQHNDDRNMTP